MAFLGVACVVAGMLTDSCLLIAFGAFLLLQGS